MYIPAENTESSTQFFHGASNQSLERLYYHEVRMRPTTNDLCLPKRLCTGKHGKLRGSLRDLQWFPLGYTLVTMSSSLGATAFVIFGVLSVVTLKELNTQVTEPYMVSLQSSRQYRVSRKCGSQDEPFHIPQVQAYCNGDWSYWDPKITTPPGL